MLGHDVVYTRSEEDVNLIQRAEIEHRILLTRDRKLFMRATTQGVNAVLLEESSRAEQIADLARRYNFELEIDPLLSRCPKCNTILTPVRKNEVIDLVPKKTYAYYNTFWACSSCKQIYWRGSHWPRIVEALEKAKKIRYTFDESMGAVTLEE